MSLTPVERTLKPDACCHLQIDQLTVNRYEPGVGLSPHVDAHSAFTGPIVALSLGSASVMEFWRDGDKRPLLLPPRSLLLMAGECRYLWCALPSDTRLAACESS